MITKYVTEQVNELNNAHVCFIYYKTSVMYAVHLSIYLRASIYDVLSIYPQAAKNQTQTQTHSYIAR